MTLHCRKSNSDQNMFFTYVCLVKDHNSKENKLPSDRCSYADDDVEVDEKEEPIRVEKSKALHELVKSQQEHDVQFHTNTGSILNAGKYHPSMPNCSDETTDDEDNVNPNVLKLTKMKWLTEGNDGSPDSRTENALTGAKLRIKKKRNLFLDDDKKDSGTEGSQETTDEVGTGEMVDKDRHLSTILKLDKEHNLFGLSSHLTKAFGRPTKRIRKDDRPVFHQTQIVQVCCADNCCKNKSNTSFPCSLECGACRICCYEKTLDCATKSSRVTSGIVFAGKSKRPPCGKSSCCKVGRKKSKTPRFVHNDYCCPPIKCGQESCTPFGMKVFINRKPKHETPPIELTPKSSSILQKPYIARPCPHCPHCVPPSSCFPYMMPCFWPSRPSAPCSHPDQCFHNPPCPPPKCPKVPESFRCPHKNPCSTKEECMFNTCLSKNQRVRDEAGLFGSQPTSKSAKEKCRGSGKNSICTKTSSATESKASRASSQSSQASSKPETAEPESLNQSGPTKVSSPISSQDSKSQTKPAIQDNKAINKIASQGNQAAAQGGQAASQTASQASQAANRTASQASQAVNKTASQASESAANKGPPKPQ